MLEADLVFAWRRANKTRFVDLKRLSLDRWKYKKRWLEEVEKYYFGQTPVKDLGVAPSVARSAVARPLGRPCWCRANRWPRS